VSINALFKSFAIDALLKDSNIINEIRTLLSKNKLRNKKRAKKENKDKQKRDKTNIARAILKTKRRKTLNKEIN